MCRGEQGWVELLVVDPVSEVALQAARVRITSSLPGLTRISSTDQQQQQGAEQSPGSSLEQVGYHRLSSGSQPHLNICRLIQRARSL